MDRVGVEAPSIEMRLNERFSWQGRDVAWGRSGSGPPVVFCHGTPWSSRLWAPFAEALESDFAVHLWDMPGYGESSKLADHRVDLGVQGELFADLLGHWGLDRRMSWPTTSAARSRCAPICSTRPNTGR
jgi:pimeloyl-ACP methyl ester carboxylesterase